MPIASLTRPSGLHLLQSFKGLASLGRVLVGAALPTDAQEVALQLFL